MELKPSLIHAARVLLRRPGFFGDYATFADAVAASNGYSSPDITSHTARSIPTGDGIHVGLRGQQVLAAFAAIGAGRLRVLDVGGANAGYYFMLRRWLPPCEWTVLETAEMCEAMRSTGIPVEYVSDADHLPNDFDVVMMSGVLQCLTEPYDALRQFGMKGRYAILNRIPLIDRDRITIQRVRNTSYAASYPAWFFNRQVFMHEVSRFADIVMRWDVTEDCVYLDGRRVCFQGMLIERRHNL
jgi:putative methyltransferase (TIGR04325 family)